MYNTAILQRGLASVSLQIALEVYPITNDPCFVTIHKLQEVPPSDTFSPALPPAILCPWQKKKIQLCPLSWIWITSQMTSVTRQIQGTQFFLTGFSQLLPLPEIGRDTTAEHLKQWSRADGKKKTDPGHSWESSRNAELKYYWETGNNVQNLF